MPKITKNHVGGSKIIEIRSMRKSAVRKVEIQSETRKKKRHTQDHVSLIANLFVIVRGYIKVTRKKTKVFFVPSTLR